MFTIKFEPGESQKLIATSMKGFGHPIVVNVLIEEGKELSARLSPIDSPANIRINQLFTPDGKADGSFGREL